MKKLLLMLLMACPLMAVAQETIDPGVARAEKMLGFVLQNQADSLYANLSDKVKGMVQKEQLENVLEQVEAQVGKYQKHGPWEIQEMMGGMGINSIEALRGNRLMLRGVGLNETELRILGISHAGE